jgi:hypothetical protein
MHRGAPAIDSVTVPLRMALLMVGIYPPADITMLDVGYFPPNTPPAN